MAINTSYTIGNSSFFVGSVLNHVLGRVCGSVYRYNDANRNTALYLNGVDQTKYPSHENATSMVWSNNIGEYVDINWFDLYHPTMANNPEPSLLDYTFDNKTTGNLNNAVSERLDTAINMAKYNISLADGSFDYVDFISDSTDWLKLNEMYTTDLLKNVNTTDGGNLNGRLLNLLGDILSTDDFNTIGQPQISKENPFYKNHIDKDASAKLHLDTVARLLSRFTVLGVNPTVYSTRGFTTKMLEPVIADDNIASYAIRYRYDGFNKLDRLSRIYQDFASGELSEDTGFQNVSRELLLSLTAVVQKGFTDDGYEKEDYIGNLDATHNASQYTKYGVEDDEWNSGYESANSVDIGGYSQNKGTNSVSTFSNRYGKYVNRAYELYDESSEGDDHILSLGKNADGNLSQGYVPFDLGEEESNIDNSSLLKRTNDLFRRGKIGSLINRFHTKAMPTDEIHSAVDSEWGMSRGRNLRKLEPSDHYGYDNPYCRVWTSIHQYSQFNNLIRPFTDGGNVMTADEIGEKLGDLRTGRKNLDKFGSMQPIGIPRIAPTEKTRNDVKRCMFSIENLAWKGVNFNATIDNTRRTVLSPEQQGPNGGRIMWFPPYNIKFNENVGVQWEGNQFIGRGEQIYTYTNTERTGTLSFTLLVDHPSIVDKWSRTKGDVTGENEQELLRFFAGCDILEPTVQTQVEEVVDSEITETKLDWIPVDPDPSPSIGSYEERYYVFFPNDFSSIDYATKENINKGMNYLLYGFKDSGYERELKVNGLDGCIDDFTYKCTNKNGKTSTWCYQPDKRCQKEVLIQTTTSIDKKDLKGHMNPNGKINNYVDTISFGLNDNFRAVAFAEDANGALVRKNFGLENVDPNSVFSFYDLCGLSSNYMNNEFADQYDVQIEVKGYASSHGYVTSNTTLADNRAKSIKTFIDSFDTFDKDAVKIVKTGWIPLSAGNLDVNSFEAKAARSVEVVVKYILKDNVQPAVNRTTEDGHVIVQNENGESGYYKEYKETRITTRKQTVVTDEDSFDNEYLYFKDLDITSPLIRKNIVSKVQFFDPAFHSITPEGFNGRLAFLHQCTRQGPTASASDLNGGKSSMGAGNLAFGRPPVCVLRIGDFYNTKIIIDSISIDYDNGGGVQWDMNPEGIGLQPMFANVNISFKFLGGSDLTGPIARLQNAVSNNFYANESVYNHRSDYRDAYVAQDKETSTQVWSATIADKSNNINHTNYNM